MTMTTSKQALRNTSGPLNAPVVRVRTHTIARYVVFEVSPGGQLSSSESVIGDLTPEQARELAAGLLLAARQVSA